MITSLGCEAVERANAIARQADIVAALTLEVLKGTTKAFDTGQQVLFGYSFNQGKLVDIFRHRGGGWQRRARRTRCPQSTQGLLQPRLSSSTVLLQLQSEDRR